MRNFLKGQPCFRSSFLAKTVMAGVFSSNAEGKIAIYAMESDEHNTFKDKIPKHSRAMRSSKNKNGSAGSSNTSWITTHAPSTATTAIRLTGPQRNGIFVTPVLTSSFLVLISQDKVAAFADQSDDNIYSRFQQPIRTELRWWCILEGICLHAASGMRHSNWPCWGKAIILQCYLWQCTPYRDYLNFFCSFWYGIEYTAVYRADKTPEWEAAISGLGHCKMIYLETPVNPTGYYWPLKL